VVPTLPCYETIVRLVLRDNKRIFAHERARGVTTYSLEAGKLVGRLEQFDPLVSHIIIEPRVTGG
jgi:hypothetical protein